MKHCNNKELNRDQLIGTKLFFFFFMGFLFLSEHMCVHAQLDLAVDPDIPREPKIATKSRKETRKPPQEDLLKPTLLCFDHLHSTFHPHGASDPRNQVLTNLNADKTRFQVGEIVTKLENGINSCILVPPANTQPNPLNTLTLSEQI